MRENKTCVESHFFAVRLLLLFYYYYEMTQRQCAYRGVHLIERTVDVDGPLHCHVALKAHVAT